MCSWNGRINIVRMFILSKAIHRVVLCSVQMPNSNGIHHRRKLILRFIWNHKRLWTDKVIITKKNKAYFPSSNYITKLWFYIYIYIYINGRREKPGLLQFWGLQGVRYNWATELNWKPIDKASVKLPNPVFLIQKIS